MHIYIYIRIYIYIFHTHLFHIHSTYIYIYINNPKRTSNSSLINITSAGAVDREFLYIETLPELSQGLPELRQSLPELALSLPKLSQSSSRPSHRLSQGLPELCRALGGFRGGSRCVLTDKKPIKCAIWNSSRMPRMPRMHVKWCHQLRLATSLHARRWSG